MTISWHTKWQQEIGCLVSGIPFFVTTRWLRGCQWVCEEKMRGRVTALESSEKFHSSLSCSPARPGCQGSVPGYSHSSLSLLRSFGFELWVFKPALVRSSSWLWQGVFVTHVQLSPRGEQEWAEGWVFWNPQAVEVEGFKGHRRSCGQGDSPRAQSPSLPLLSPHWGFGISLFL